MKSIALVHLELQLCEKLGIDQYQAERQYDEYCEYVVPRGEGRYMEYEAYLLHLVDGLVINEIIDNANEHKHKKPNIRTLWEEVSEATLASRGKHEHPLRLELIQIAGICINMIRQIDAGEDFKK